MIAFIGSGRSSALGVPFAALAMVTAMASVVAVGCAPDQPGQKSCASHSECHVGQVCGSNDQCVVVDNCDFCEGVEGLVCIETEDHPDGVCSKPECQTAADCPEPGEVCTTAGKCSGAECQEDSDCPAGEICNVVDQCAPAGDTGVPTDAGEQDSGYEDAGPGDDGSSIPDGEGGDAGSCDPNQIEQCPPSGSPSAEHWSSQYCTCVECLEDRHCSGSQECRGGSCSSACTQSCSGGGGDNNCPDAKPYCISECCVECIGASDCPDGELCVDDQCTPSNTGGDCSQGDCPTGYSCNTTSGKCERESSNQGCSQSDPTCPTGETCNLQTGKCEPVSGGQSCGNCNAGCTCPQGSTCDTQLFMCTGCTYSITGSKGCPTGQSCIPARLISAQLPNVCM